VRDWPFILAGTIFVAIALVANEWVLGAWLTIGGRVTNPATRLVLAALDILCLIVGLTLLIRRRRAPWRQMILSGVTTVLALLLAEGGLRVVFSVRARLSPDSRALAETVGWAPRANFSFDQDVPHYGRVRYRTTRDGFRVFGDPASKKFKIFVIGDSYTEGATVSEGETYYERLSRMLPDVELFALGGGGYGTLQEYQQLDRWVDEVRPNLVLVQMHPNDLINNSHALESASTTDNNQMTRPYWENGRVVMRFPENPAWGPLYNVVRHSHLLRLINVNLTFLRAKRVSSIEQTARRDDPNVVQATATTIELLRMMERRARVPVAAFSSRPDDAFAFWSVSEVCRRAEVEFIAGVGEAVAAAHDAGERVSGLPVDAHWNGRGHEIAAAVIRQWLEEYRRRSSLGRDGGLP
jgi:hypothetical protein